MMPSNENTILRWKKEDRKKEIKRQLKMKSNQKLKKKKILFQMKNGKNMEKLISHVSMIQNVLI